MLALLALAAPASAAPKTERDCIKAYISARKDPEKSLRILRRCAGDHSNSAVIGTMNTDSGATAAACRATFAKAAQVITTQP